MRVLHVCLIAHVSLKWKSVRHGWKINVTNTGNKYIRQQFNANYISLGKTRLTPPWAI